MKKEPYRLKIESPCAENWDTMQSVPGGKFCDQCTRKLIDFSSMSDIQIISLLKQKGQPICGRFLNHQLNRALIPAETPAKRLQFAPVLAGILWLATPDHAVAQTENRVVQTAAPVDTDPGDSLPKMLHGSITDRDMRHPVAYASCHIEGTDVHFTSDSLGNFNAQIPDSLVGRDLVMRITHPDYPDQRLAFRPIIGLQGGNLFRLMRNGTVIDLPLLPVYTLGLVGTNTTRN